MEVQPTKRSILKTTIVNPLKRKQRFHFSLENDIQLLTLDLKYNPWLYGVQQWEEISKEMLSESLIIAGRGSVSARSARDRTSHLLQLYKLQDLQSIDKGSTPELYHQRALLVAQVAHLKENSEQIAMSEINIENPRTESNEEDQCVEFDPINVSECSNTSVNSTNIIELKSFRTKRKSNDADLDEEGGEDEEHKASNKESSDYAKRKYLAITKRIEMEMNLKVKEFALKQKQLEEDMKLKRMKTEADIAWKKKELELEDRRLILEEMKTVQQNKIQQEMLEQQKLMLTVMAKLTDNKKK